MTIVPDSVLVKSKSARDHQLESISPQRAQEILNKVKALFFAVWKGEGITTIEQLAGFYKIEPNSIRQVLKCHQDEFELDKLKNLRGRNLKEGVLSEDVAPPCVFFGWNEWADEAVKRRLMEYSHSHGGNSMVHLAGGGQGLWSQLTFPALVGSRII